MGDSARRAEAVEQRNSSSDLHCGAVALDAHGTHPHFEGRPAPGQDFQHVADGRSRRAGDQDHAARKARDRLLAPGIKEAPDRQLLLQLAEGQFQRTDALGLHLFHQELILAALFIDGDPAAGDDAHAVAEIEFHAQGHAAIENGLERGGLVLERQVDVPGRRAGQVGHLALDPEVGKILFELSPDGARQFPHGQHLDAGGWKEHAHRQLPAWDKGVEYTSTAVRSKRSIWGPAKQRNRPCGPSSLVSPPHPTPTPCNRWATSGSVTWSTSSMRSASVICISSRTPAGSSRRSASLSRGKTT